MLHFKCESTASEEQSSTNKESNRSIGGVNQRSMETAEAMQSEGEPKALGT
jgi:methyl-accepting chemotaxis protein